MRDWRAGWDSPRRRYWILQSLGWACYALVTVLALLPSAAPGTVGRLMVIKLCYATSGFLATDLLRRVLERIRALGRGGLTLTALLLGAPVTAVLWYFALSVLLRVVPVGSPAPFEWRQVPSGVVHLLPLTVAWTALFWLGRAYALAEAARTRARQAEALAANAQLRLLQHQLNPHFLFNALNSLRRVISEDPARAGAMTSRLAILLRYALSEEPDALVPLARELEYVRAYIDLEQLRYEDQLSVEYAVEPAAEEWLIPPFLLQPLVENAIKHGLARRGTVLRLRVAATTQEDQLVVTVGNGGALKEPALAGAQHRNGNGLRLVAERLQVQLPGKARLALDEHDGWVTATVALSR